jgi:hypothetical protein
MTAPDQYEPDVHTLDVRVVAQPKPVQERLYGRYRIATITDVDEAVDLLPASEDRICAYVQPLDDDVVISGNRSDAESGAGTRIPKANTSPYPIYDQGVLYVAAPVIGATTSRVSVSATYRVAQ